MAKEKVKHELSECTKMILPVKDALDILNGKWKLPIMISLKFGNKRFKQISNEIPGISMMSELVKKEQLNEKAKDEVEIISSACNELVQQLREIVWTLNPQNDSLKNLMVYLRQYASSLFENSPIACNIRMPVQIPEYSVVGK